MCDCPNCDYTMRVSDGDYTPEFLRLALGDKPCIKQPNVKEYVNCGSEHRAGEFSTPRLFGRAAAKARSIKPYEIC